MYFACSKRCCMSGICMCHPVILRLALDIRHLDLLQSTLIQNNGKGVGLSLGCQWTSWLIGKLNWGLSAPIHHFALLRPHLCPLCLQCLWRKSDSTVPPGKTLRTSCWRQGLGDLLRSAKAVSRYIAREMERDAPGNLGCRVLQGVPQIAEQSKPWSKWNPATQQTANFHQCLSFVRRWGGINFLHYLHACQSLGKTHPK